jgi:hypothetical protein
MTAPTRRPGTRSSFRQLTHDGNDERQQRRLQVSGVVRGWNAGTAQLRFDTDILDTQQSRRRERRSTSRQDRAPAERRSQLRAANQTAILDNTR